MELLQHGCDLNVKIRAEKMWFIGYKRSILGGEKLARMRNGFGRRGFAVEFVSNCARNAVEGSK